MSKPPKPPHRSYGFQPGQSGNPKGRAKGFKGVAALIMRETRDGAELVEWALGIWRDPTVSQDVRWQAHDWLSRRGLGNPVTVLDLNPDAEEVRDLSMLSDEALGIIDAQFTEAGLVLVPSDEPLELGNGQATESELPRQLSGVEPDGVIKP